MGQIAWGGGDMKEMFRMGNDDAAVATSGGGRGESGNNNYSMDDE